MIEDLWLAHVPEEGRGAASAVIDLDSDTRTCPACGTSYPAGPPKCPGCGLYLGG